MTEHSVARTRQTYDKVKGLAADSAVIVEDVMVAASIPEPRRSPKKLCAMRK